MWEESVRGRERDFLNVRKRRREWESKTVGGEGGKKETDRKKEKGGEREK